MTEVSTRPQVGANTPSRASRIASAAASRPAIEFDSTAFDTISGRVEEIQALASCAQCLSAVEADGGDFAGNVLIDEALPLLAEVISRLAGEVGVASDRMWEQYTQARALANGEVTQ